MSSTIGGVDSSFALGRLQAETVTQDRELAKAGNISEQASRAEIKKVADEFESLFLNLVLKSMRNTVQKSGFVDGGNAEDIYRSMLDDEYSKMMAEQRHTGIATQIEGFLLEAQGLEDKAKGGISPAFVQAKIADLKAGLSTYKDAALQNPGKQGTMDRGAAPGRASDIGPAPRIKAL